MYQGKAVQLKEFKRFMTHEELQNTLRIRIQTLNMDKMVVDLDRSILK